MLWFLRYFTPYTLLKRVMFLGLCVPIIVWLSSLGRVESISNWGRFSAPTVSVITVFNMVAMGLDIRGQVSEHSHSVGTKRGEATRHKATPNEIPSWELCKYFHPLPLPVDRLIPLALLINQRGVERGWDGRTWISGHMAVVGNCPYQHPVMQLYHVLYSDTWVKIAFCVAQYCRQDVCYGHSFFCSLRFINLFCDFLCRIFWWLSNFSLLLLGWDKLFLNDIALGIKACNI